MADDTVIVATSDADRRDAFAGALFGAAIGALDLMHVYVGDRLGLYEAMASGGPQTPAELARAAGIDERYAREWLEHQAVAKVVDVVSAEHIGERRYALPIEHAEVLLDRTSINYLAPLGLAVMGVSAALPRVLEAFRTGGGVPYEAYGADIRDAISRGNRPMFWNLLAQEWFPAVPGLVERLNADPPARVADVGCGTGWSSISIARGFPTVTVDGLDLDNSSIDDARRNAEECGITDRVDFQVRDAADPALAGRYDLVCAFETLHDMCDPVSALRAMRALCADGGIVLIADERVADSFTTEVEDGERFQWGWSALHCLPVALTAPPAAGTGTIIRYPTLVGYAQQAGFRDVEILPIENMLWRFYRLIG